MQLEMEKNRKMGSGSVRLLHKWNLEKNDYVVVICYELTVKYQLNH